MTEHLLLVSLGPVQDFIASARRCQDLWFGSYLLSELSREAAAAIRAMAGPMSLIFPGALGNDKASVANKIVAILPTGMKPESVARAGEKAMQDRLREIAADLFRRLPEKGFNRPLAMQQVGDLMEYLWVAAPREPGDPGYAHARQQAELLLTWRKNTRVWAAASSAAGQCVPKSSLDGQRESVLDESLYQQVASGQMTAEQLRKRYYVRKSERLCGVGLLKRMGEEVEEDGVRPDFHSNSHVASGPLRKRIQRMGAAGHEAQAQYLTELQGLGVNLGRFRDGEDGSLLFSDRLPEVFELYAGALLPEAQQERTSAAQRALQAFMSKIKQEDPPIPYYALLLADGDRMGQAIDELQGLAQHQALSQALEGFALSCSATVTAHLGSLIYSGGDDVMALLPLHTALACADQLQRDFQEALREVTAACQSPPTLSVGLGIAHHMDSMSEARRLAKHAEDLAKQARNSLAIIVDKRSGASVAVTGQWSQAPALHQRIEQWRRLLHEEKLPDSAAFDLEAAITPLLVRDPEDQQRRTELTEVASALARRAAQRRRKSRGEESIDEEVRGLLEGSFTTHADPIEAVLALSAELQIARLFQRAHDDADDWGEVTP